MMRMLKKALFALLPILLPVVSANAQSSYDLRSPNNKIEVKIRTANGVRYDVLLNGRAVLQDCTLSLDVDRKKFGVQAKVLKHKRAATTRCSSRWCGRNSRRFETTIKSCIWIWMAATP